MKRVTFLNCKISLGNMGQLLLWLVMIPGGLSEKLTTYFLNSEETFRNPLPDDSADIECVHTDVTNTIPLSSKITICYRMQPMRYILTMNELNEPWATIMSFGTIRDDFKALDEGIVIGAWEDEIWFGLKNKTQKSYLWQSLGKNFMHDVQIWRHTCVSIDFETKTIKLFENGEKRHEKVSQVLQTIGLTMNHVTPGCSYKFSRYQSMYGRVTDVQIFRKVLTDKMMEVITGCEERMKGDLLSWDDTKWIRSGTKQDIRQETLDWKTDICKTITKSYHLIPIRLDNIPNSIKSCKKYSTELAMWENKDEMNDITKHLSSYNMMAAKSCQQRNNKIKNIFTMRVWLAGTDNEEEGVWTNFYTNDVIQPQPWAENRPFLNGESYNCILLDVTMIDNDEQFGEVTNVEIKDKKCKADLFCSLCTVNSPILEIHVRGLCKDSIFDTVYLFNTDKNGELVYFGEKSSMISYDKDQRKWLWYDMKSNMSIATSSSPHSSLLMGVHMVDFSNVLDDPCVEDGTVRKLKFTRCTSGKFTCNDGHCVDIEQRCDNVEQCPDKSDEFDCKVVTLKKTYEKSIAPFSLDLERNR